MKLIGKIFLSFAASSITFPISQEIFETSKETSNYLYFIILLSLSIYFTGAEIGFWKDIFFDN